ncbi:MAG TPA: hypothetical protein VF865_06465 [Acidobacteriaceae bacterium]
MGMMSFLNMEGGDLVAFVVSGVVGFIAGTMVPDHTLAIYVSILLSYHLFLAWLVFGSSQKPVGSLPVVMTALTHVACMTVVLGPVLMARHTTPMFGLFRYSIAALALFERGWLHAAAGTRKRQPQEERPVEAPEPVPEAVPAPPARIRTTPEDQAAWREYLAQRGAGMTRAGMTMQAEYEQWLRRRYKDRPADASQASTLVH